MNSIHENTQKNNEKLARSAVAYASRFHWPVLPIHSISGGHCTCQNPACSSPGKHPLTKNGVKDATTDIRTIATWWQRWPLANIAIATGAAAGFFVVDVDGENGAESLQGLENKYGKFPETIEAITGGGGRHILFRYPVDMVVGNKVGLTDGVDIRGNGGYVLAAPSLHISGRPYMWELSSRPGEVELAEAPGWLLAMLDKKEPQGLSRTIEDWRTLVNQGISEGKRNASIAALAGHLFRHYVDPWIVLDLILSWNKTKCRPPLSDSEVSQTVDSVAKLEAKRREGAINGTHRH